MSRLLGGLASSSKLNYAVDCEHGLALDRCLNCNQSLRACGAQEHQGFLKRLGTPKYHTDLQYRRNDFLNRLIRRDNHEPITHSGARAGL
jgi:hypothetical protein